MYVEKVKKKKKLKSLVNNTYLILSTLVFKNYPTTKKLHMANLFNKQTEHFK